MAIAISALREDFRPFLEALGYRADEAPGAHPSTLLGTVPDSTASDKTNAATITRLQTSLATAERAEAKTARELKAIQSQKRDLESNLVLTERKLTASANALEALGTQHAQLQHSIESSIERGIEERLNARLYPWLAPAEALDRAARASNTAPLLERARTTLARQAALDRRYGLWSQLHAERAALRDVLAATRTAQLESLRPLPELATTQTELETRITELETLLCIGPSGRKSDGPLTAIRQRLAEATSIDQLAVVHAGIRATADLGVLSGQMLSDAYGLINAAFERCYDQSTRQRGAAPAAVATARTSFIALRRCLEHHTACTLLIDGHNCLFALRELLDLPFDEEGPSPGACQHFAGRLVPVARQHRHLAIQLWFDSSTAAIEPVEENLRVHYSGGTGRDRADQGIISYLRSRVHAPRKSTDHPFVVTADRAEAAEVEATGARVIAPEEFVSLLI
jgi:hypothetical protein